VGTGSFNNGKFDFVVVASHSLSDAEKTEWQARFIEASRALYEASEGQLSFGQIFVSDDDWGLGHAEFVLHGFESTAYATLGGYGEMGLATQLFANQRTGDPRTIVHEFGHHAFALYDEYTGPVQQDEIDPDVTPPSYSNDPPLYDVVPLQPSENYSASLEFANAILKFGGRVERLIVREHTPTELRVYGSFSQDPREADGGRIFYQPQYGEDGFIIGCAEDSSANFCLMDQYDRDGQPGDNQAVTEFCSANNHDPDGDTSHNDAYGGLSCWSVIQGEMQDRYDYPLQAPDPAQPGQQTDDYPVFYDLEKEARVALVMDRSGSMSEDNKIEGARWGVDFWIRNAAETGDFLSVTWFNQEVETRSALAEFAGDADLQPVIDDVNAVAPGGYTNIRDALFEAVAQIESREGRAALQAIVLLTDGIHNRPEDTLLQEAIPTLQAAGIPVYVIALGTTEHVDYPALEELALQTGGIITQVAAFVDPLDAALQQAVIATEIIRVNLLLRNGQVQVGAGEIGEAPPDSDFAKLIARARGRRLNLKDLVKFEGLKEIGDFTRRRRHPRSFSVPFLVEKGALSANFSITYPLKQKFHLYLIDPIGNQVEFDSSRAVLIDPETPYATAIVRKPKPGLWHAVIVRASDGPAARVNYVAGVENRKIVVHGSCDREVPVGMPVSITANAVWRDRLSGLRVTAQITGPDGSRHTVVLSDETNDEPNSGAYRGSFTPQAAGRYSGEIRIVSNGDAVYAGGIHRVVHAPQNGRDPVKYELKSEAPAFIRRTPIYFDAGTRPVPKDLDGRRSGGVRVPPRGRRTGLTPIRIDDALDLVRRGG
jgi:hypothetical protein